jgi:hypothetical protein
MARTELGHIDRALYPTGIFFSVSSDAPETPEQRVEWLKLFLLGSLQTIGWTTPQANRNFIVECTERGWLHDIADDSSQPGRWLESLKAHIGDQESEIKYFQWMKHLVGLAIIAEHLDEYVELFLAVDRIGQHFSLDSVSSPRTSSFFQGGGPDAPPVSEVLGIGQCFHHARVGPPRDSNERPRVPSLLRTLSSAPVAWCPDWAARSWTIAKSAAGIDHGGFTTFCAAFSNIAPRLICALTYLFG